ncbi:ParB/RepB/Spo0J family partition protein [Phycicoccus sp. HDW14]|uniref:ParB/RepB/Spo0J family partition protein n=1 Tax=Phycicoccus sp. HDW14 TaxID=2714941 RepID=UPI00140E7224|nr:ParB/RepB/Spo0J family partition protein [Phycicoccus sp. HDW14]QIM20566.1 ParB/RepB/Spo0J family partition protein [Phycicoccus sp. HDW14]
MRLVEVALRQSVAKAAEVTGLSYPHAAEIARTHGYPDTEAMRASLEQLRAAAQEKPAAAAEAMTGRTLVTVALADVHPDPDNPREDLGDVDELAESIRQSGLLQPIVVRRHGAALVVVAGHRRLAALQRLGHASTEVIVSKDLRPDDVLAAMLIENGQRRDLSPMEEARALNRLKVSKSWTGQELAKRIGRSDSFVSNRLALLNLSTEQQDLVEAGQMGVTQASTVGRARAGTARPTPPTASTSARSTRSPVASEHAASTSTVAVHDRSG